MTSYTSVMTKILFKQNDVFNSSSVKFELIPLKLQHYIYNSFFFTSLHKLKSCLMRGILLSRLLKSENSFELQINFQINIHICAQSCTWKKLSNYKKFERLFSFYRVKELVIWTLYLRYCLFCPGRHVFFLSWMKWFRYHDKDSFFSLCHDSSSGK